MYWFTARHKDIVEHGGISPAMVTKLRNGERGLTKETAEKVAAGLAKAGYCGICGEFAMAGICPQCERLIHVSKQAAEEEA